MRSNLPMTFLSLFIPIRSAWRSSPILLSQNLWSFLCFFLPFFPSQNLPFLFLFPFLFFLQIIWGWGDIWGRWRERVDNLLFFFFFFYNYYLLIIIIFFFFFGSLHASFPKSRSLSALAIAEARSWAARRSNSFFERGHSKH